MNSSVKKTFFILLSIVVIGILLVFIFLLGTSAKSKSLQIDDTVTEVFLGDSHVRYAVNDALLSSSINLGNSSESVYFSYHKLKLLLKSNPSIKTVYLGFSYHNISEYYDEYIYGQYAPSVASNYFYILSFAEQMQQIKWNFKRLPSFLVATMKSGVKIWRNENTFEGGFNNPHTSTEANMATMDERLNSQYYTYDTLSSFSTLNLRYFDNIVALCSDLGVELVIVNTPMHLYYKSKIPQKFIDKYNSIINANNLRTIDLTLLELSNTSFQADGDLVSFEGAMRATEEIKQSIRNKIW